MVSKLSRNGTREPGYQAIHGCELSAKLYPWPIELSEMSTSSIKCRRLRRLLGRGVGNLGVALCNTEGNA